MLHFLPRRGKGQTKSVITDEHMTHTATTRQPKGKRSGTPLLGRRVSTRGAVPVWEGPLWGKTVALNMIRGTEELERFKKVAMSEALPRLKRI